MTETHHIEYPLTITIVPGEPAQIAAGASSGGAHHANARNDPVQVPWWFYLATALLTLLLAIMTAYVTAYRIYTDTTICIAPRTAIMPKK